MVLFAKDSLAQNILDSVVVPKAKENSVIEKKLFDFYVDFGLKIKQINGQVKERDAIFLQNIKSTLFLDEQGEPLEAKLVKSSNNENYDNGVISILKKTGQWNPAFYKGKPIKSQILLMIDQGKVKYIKVLSIGETNSITSSLPIFRGGFDEMNKFLKKNIIYPETLKQNKIIGQAVVKFLVDSLGNVSNITIRQSSGYELFDSESLRLIASMPKWIPSYQGSKRLNAYCDVVIPYGNKNMLAELNETKKNLSQEMYSQAQSAFLAENTNTAKEKFKQAYLLNCYNSDALYKLGVSYFKLNQKDSACYCWNELKVNFARKDADELIKKYCSN